MQRKGATTAALLVLAACGTPGQRGSTSPAEITKLPWQTIMQHARGTTVNFGMWAGDEERNRYFRSTVAEGMVRDYKITLRLVPNSDTAELVNKLLNEKGAGKRKGGSMDMVWINGENFRTAKQAGLLWGPFAD